MASVTQRIGQIKQPQGGYLPVSKMEKIQLKDNNELSENENISAALIGMAVDYMTRYLSGASKEDAFKISLMGASIINETRFAQKLLKSVNGFDDESIIAACKLVGYDVCFRAGTAHYKDVRDIEPNEDTISNIRIMIKRGLIFFKEYGPVIEDGITFEGAYTSTIDAGDGDFITEDTLWDFKVSKSAITTKHTLQLLVYYLMGKKSIHSHFDNITKIGVFNPRKNMVYLKDISEIDESILKDIETDVIGYGNRKSKSNINTTSNTSSMLTITDLTRILGCSRNKVMKYYAENGLPLEKIKNRYYIDENDLEIWLESKRKTEIRNKILSVVFSLISFYIMFKVIMFFYSDIVEDFKILMP